MARVRSAPGVHRARAAALLLCGVLASAPAFCAGGHHAVDDAATLDRGQCQFETWADRYGPGHGAWHAGSACRVGAWEVGVNVDDTRLGGGPASRVVGPQVKWATSIAAGWSAGVVLSAGWQAGRYQDTAALALLTWQPAPAWRLHANLGRDIPREGSGRTLGGVAAEWSAGEALGFVAERFNDGIGRGARVGARWQLTPGISLDLSRAHAFRDARGNWWTLGANFVGDGFLR